LVVTTVVLMAGVVLKGCQLPLFLQVAVDRSLAMLSLSNMNQLLG